MFTDPLCSRCEGTLTIDGISECFGTAYRLPLREPPFVIRDLADIEHSKLFSRFDHAIESHHPYLI
jgi:hypothetical protein